MLFVILGCKICDQTNPATKRGSHPLTPSNASKTKNKTNKKPLKEKTSLSGNISKTKDRKRQNKKRLSHTPPPLLLLTPFSSSVSSGHSARLTHGCIIQQHLVHPHCWCIAQLHQTTSLCLRPTTFIGGVHPTAAAATTSKQRRSLHFFQSHLLLYISAFCPLIVFFFIIIIIINIVIINILILIHIKISINEGATKVKVCHK